MHFAAIGFFGSLFEAAARAIGTGIVVGGFAGATVGLVNRWSRKEVEGNALRHGYFGAVTACLSCVADLIVRYLLSS